MAVDPRAHNPKPIPGPGPLPFVSRRALARVRDWMPPPKYCPACGGEVSLLNNQQVYGRSLGEWPYVYACLPCDAYVGLHPFTDLPLGTMATASVRAARKKGKDWFHKLQRRHQWSRREAYQWLAEQLHIPAAECHWGMFDQAQAIAAGRVCQAAYLNGLPRAAH